MSRSGATRCRSVGGVLAEAVAHATANGVRLRHMTTADLRTVADLHRAYLSDGFFAALGPGFLRAYLATFLDSIVSIALVAEHGDKTIGFLVGSFDHRAHVRMTVRRHGARLVGRGLLAMLIRPQVAWRFLRTRARRYFAGLARTSLRSPRPGPPGAVAAGLGHVAVLPKARSAGVGSALVEEFLTRVQAFGVSRVQLSTRAGDAGAGSFYERLGWTRAATFTDADGVSWARYCIEL